jgi:hypothetical protein
MPKKFELFNVRASLMPYYFFVWTEEIIEHLAEHDVSPEDFEAIVSNPADEDVSRSTGNPVVFGTAADGRRLCCVFKRLDDDTIEPVTAYEVGE